MSSKVAFPHIHNSGKAEIQDNNITFSYVDSYGHGLTETAKVLSPRRMAMMIEARMKRFHSAGPGSRESEQSRQERKYISAHPEETLREAWNILDDHGKMEMDMMLDPSSHHGISDPDWIKSHVKRRDEIIGDDKRELS